MAGKPKNLSRGPKKKSMLSDLLEKWRLNYVAFAKYLDIDRVSLSRYRRGEREFRLNMEQIHKLEKLLEEIGMRFEDLPPDWFLDKEEDSYADGPKTIPEKLE